jgi:hypothetical protein
MEVSRSLLSLKGSRCRRNLAALGKEFFGAPPGAGTRSAKRVMPETRSVCCSSGGIPSERGVCRPLAASPPGAAGWLKYEHVPRDMAVIETMAAGDRLFLLFAYMHFLLIALAVVQRYVKTSDLGDVFLVHFAVVVIMVVFLDFALKSGELRYVALGVAALASLLAYYAAESMLDREE